MALFANRSRKCKFPFCIFRITRNCQKLRCATNKDMYTCLSAGIVHILKRWSQVHCQSRTTDRRRLINMTVPPKMDLTCVVRRHVKVLSRRKCNFSDAVFNPSQFVDIFPDPQLTSLFTIARSKEIGVQCQACDVSALNVSQY
jgi:hypothetical protein